MASNPSEARQHQTEALAAALFLASAYSLPQLIRTAKVTPRPYRRVEATEALRAATAAPYFDLVRAWRAERETLLAAYALALPIRGRAASADAATTVQTAIDQAAVRIQLAELERRFSGILPRLDQWFRLQWIARVRVATGLDVALLTGRHTGQSEVANAAARNAQLLASVHDETKNRIATLMLASLAGSAPVAAVSSAYSGAMDKARARSARIAVDQTDMAVEALSRVRRAEAGLSRFRWRHYNQQPHPRPEHVIRDMRVYSQGNAPNDRAGVLPFCKCWEETTWE